MKYVANDFEVIIFSNSISHDEVATKLTKPVKSAGFLRISEDKVYCFGYSNSLNLHSCVDDETLIQSQLER